MRAGLSFRSAGLQNARISGFLLNGLKNRQRAKRAAGR